MPSEEHALGAMRCRLACCVQPSEAVYMCAASDSCSRHVQGCHVMTSSWGLEQSGHKHHAVPRNLSLDHH